MGRGIREAVSAGYEKSFLVGRAQVVLERGTTMVQYAERVESRGCRKVYVKVQ